jgi:drug/metabolite transporter (DMT)-like permease
MSQPRKDLDAAAVGTMLVLTAIWGAQQVAIKLAAADVVPVMQVALRNGVSAVLLLAFCRARGETLSLGGRTLRAGLLVGALFGVEFFFIGEGLRHTTASHMAVFLYTAPVFTALGLHLTLPAERLGRSQWLGVVTAFAGIVLAFAGGWLRGDVTLRALAGDALGVLAGATWAATTVAIRASTLSEAPPATTLLYQLAGGLLLPLAAAAAWGQASQVSMTPVAWASLTFQGVVVSFASYLAWFGLLRRYLASRLSVFAFLTPLFGVSFGVLVLGERVDVFFGAGAALVLLGVLVVSGRALLLPRARTS